MKKKLLALVMTAVMGLSIAGCGNRKLIDTTWSYEYAIVSLPNGEIVKGKVGSWSDYGDGDMLQVEINGKKYLTHSDNVVLISED